MKIEIKSDVTEQPKEIHDVDSIDYNALFVDSHGAIGVLVKDLYDKDMVAWFDEDEIYVFPTRTIGFPVKLIKNKTVTLTF